MMMVMMMFSAHLSVCNNLKDLLQSRHHLLQHSVHLIDDIVEDNDYEGDEMMMMMMME